MGDIKQVAETIRSKTEPLIAEIEKVIVGKHEAVRLTVAVLLARGHALVEDIPGVGKTTLAKSLARALGCEFKRIQFTPDLLPGDVTGVAIYNQKTMEFRFTPGPVFTNILLADEINRATPKTQSSLLECMDELQVTVDGTSHQVPRPFFVIATENPIEYRGTFPLPEAQIDRFLIRLKLGYTEPSEEVEILNRQIMHHPVQDLRPVLSGDELLKLQESVPSIYVADIVKQYIVSIVGATREHSAVALGASPRGSLAMMRLAQARAALQGRHYVTPDDIKEIAEPVLAHRLILRMESASERNGVDIIHDVVQQIPVPIAAP